MTTSTNSIFISHATETIRFHPHLKQSTVEVSGQGGDVVLSGTVQSFFEKQMAQESLRGVSGITSITNTIEVNWQ